jgi:tRNA U34 2-thiouridine synthase MnmA/TrmU
MTKAVALVSGGLDSMLAVKLVQLQGVDVLALHFVSVFNCGARPGKGLAARKAADALGCPLRLVDFTARQMELVRNPPHGFGSAANPCIDCHMTMLLEAARIMEDVGADFIVTGEVVGQRPMSQRRFALGLIDKSTGLGGKILRPLSARELPATEAESKGLVDRERLEGVTGRTRTRQMALAKEFGLTAYPSPAGGCLLTDGEFGIRVKDLLAHGIFDLNNAHLIKVGRHYRLDGETKAIVGRDERENIVIETFWQQGDAIITIEDISGPTTLVRGRTDDKNLASAAALTARASKARSAPAARLRVRRARGGAPGGIITVAPATDDFAAALTISAKSLS